jgi:hypothetical protein
MIIITNNCTIIGIVGLIAVGSLIPTKLPTTPDSCSGSAISVTSDVHGNIYVACYVFKLLHKYHIISYIMEYIHSFIFVRSLATML